jgi:hypothetical protein
MLHLPSGYEILQACTQPTKVEDEPFWYHSFLEEIWVMTISMNFVLTFEERKKTLDNFEHFDLRDDNELDPNIWWGSRQRS